MEVLAEPEAHCTSRAVHRYHDFSAWRFTPLTRYLARDPLFGGATKRIEILSDATMKPIDSNTNRSSASGRAPAIQPSTDECRA